MQLSICRGAHAAARPGCRAFRPAQLKHQRTRMLVRSNDADSTPSPTAAEVSTSSTTPQSSISTPVQTPPAANNASGSAAGSSGNTGLAGGAVAAGVALFLATRLLTGGPSLAALEQVAVPLDVALSNGRPTVVEFYANWCEVCRELVPTEYEVEQLYKDKVNFVMLNVENTKWAPEVQEYGVNGIPHFVFMNDQGTPLAAAVGRLPREVLEGNVAALAGGRQQLPYAAVRGQTSSLAPPTSMVSSKSSAGPRDHA